MLGYQVQGEKKNIVTVALSGVPDIRGDIMTLSNEQLGKSKYSRIVFQDVCSLNQAMGASPCDHSNDSYKPIKVRDLAMKINELIAHSGGYVFFRHCLSVVYIGGVLDYDKREEFIQSFQDAGFDHVERFHPPLSLSQYSPGDDIPSDYGAKKCQNLGAWQPENGAIVFFKPRSISYVDSR